MTKEVELFYLPNCRYCRDAISWISELEAEDERYKAIKIKLINEREERVIARSRDYYYVPTCYINGVKIHEGVATKQIIQSILDKAISE